MDVTVTEWLSDRSERVRNKRTAFVIVSVIGQRLESESRELSVPPQPPTRISGSVAVRRGGGCTAAHAGLVIGVPSAAQLGVAAMHRLAVRLRVATECGVAEWAEWACRCGGGGGCRGTVTEPLSLRPVTTVPIATPSLFGTQRRCKAHTPTRHECGARWAAMGGSAVASGSGGEARAARVSPGCRKVHGKVALASPGLHNRLLSCNTTACR